MKNNTLITVIILLFCFVHGVNGHDVKNITSSKPAIYSHFDKSLQMTDKFQTRLDVIKLNKSQKPVLKPEQQRFFMDTALILSNIVVPERHICTYSETGEKLTFLIQNYDNNSWVNSALETSTFDSDGNKLTSLWTVFDNNSWINFSYEVNSYLNSKLVSSLKQVWDNSAWINLERETLEYDAYGNLVSYLRETWLFVSWVNVEHEMYTYDDQGNMLTRLREIWDNGGWLNERYDTFSYNATGNLLVGTFQIWVNGEWTNSFRETNTYNSNNYLISYTDEVWSGGTWKFNERYTYTYDGFGYVSMGIGEIWNNGQWSNNEKGSFSYNSFGGPESSLLQSWANNTWLNISLTTSDYDGSGNARIGKYFIWTGQTWSQNQDGPIPMYYDSSTKTEYYIGHTVNAHYDSREIGINEISDGNLRSFTCNPNPANGSTILTLDLAAMSDVKVSIRDITGKELQTIFMGALSQGSHQFKISTQSMTSGIYLAEIEGEGFGKIFKLLISH